ncbi:MAG: bifunctional 4-hydroxy-2-oxoglutarate aldolase/2-dehydro-3-deoxy-phosphogluconate aldolase [Nocardioides sp.]|nr:bifunctional 4-hydroxy-2-oxoglutarate aldolase/2-dehydro-3-deoxy-phosphogluconate aldolase [Nocardioides sp.]
MTLPTTELAPGLPICDFTAFGGTGDLALRKLLPALYQREREGQLPAGNQRGGAEILVGAGTILTPDHAEQARAAGARFLVSPGATPTLLRSMADTGLPYLPGTATVSEVLAVLEAGVREMKFFPAEAPGGTAFLSAIASPVPAARFCPTGGITEANAAAYLSLPNVGCVGGSWLTPADAVRGGDWARLARLAREAAALR